MAEKHIGGHHPPSWTIPTACEEPEAAFASSAVCSLSRMASSGAGDRKMFARSILRESRRQGNSRPSAANLAEPLVSCLRVEEIYRTAVSVFHSNECTRAFAATGDPLTVTALMCRNAGRGKLNRVARSASRHRGDLAR